MKKIIASVLAVVLVACAFCTVSASAAEDTNLLAGLSYTATYNAFLGSCTDSESTLLTDGAYRGDGTNAFNADSGVPGVTVEYAGSSQIDIFEFAFEDATDIATIVLRNVRMASNRSFSLLTVGATTDGINYTNVETSVESVAVEGAPQYGQESPVDQYFDVTITVDIKDATGLKVSLTSNGQYVLQLDEIEAYAPAASDEPSSSEEAPSEEPSSDVSSDDESSDDESSDVSVDETSEVESSDESSEEVVVIAETTYTVTLTENEDGTATIKVTIPEGIGNGKVVLSTSEDLTYIDKSVSSAIMATINATAENITATFASATTYDAGSVVFEAKYTIADDAELTAADIIVSEWEIGDGDNMLCSNEDGDVIKVLNLIEDETSDVESSDDSSSDDQKTENTGDAGIAVFAVLAVISAGAVVVLKKRA